MKKIKVLDQVTNADYKKFKPDHTFDKRHENKPVTSVTFTDAMAYAKWLSLTTGRKFRLITEDERKEAESTFKADFSRHPLPEMPDVGTFGCNDQGVTGLLGVTYDWCAKPEDIADPVSLGWATAPQAKTQSVTIKEDCFRPIRGDVWYFATKSVASSSGTSVSYYKGNLGFRLVEEEHTAVEKIVRGSCSEDPNGLSEHVAFDFYNQNLKHEKFGFRLVEEVN